MVQPQELWGGYPRKEAGRAALKRGGGGGGGGGEV